MKFTLGKKGLKKSWQDDFPEEVNCVHCKGKARIGFVAHEGFGEDIAHRKCVCSLYQDNDLWLHDCCAVAVYFCKECLKPTALFNQA